VQNLVARSLEATGGATGQEEAHALEVFEGHYLAGIADRTRPYAGVVEGMEALARAGIPMGCVTNKAARFTEPLLERTGLMRFMRVVVSGDTVANKKPHPEPMLHAAARLGVEPSEALMVGDSLNDVAAAKAAGCPVVVVPYGYREGLPVEELGADAVFATVEAAAKSITMDA
jgi:phosphoglycolate phosphatase